MRRHAPPRHLASHARAYANKIIVDLVRCGVGYRSHGLAAAHDGPDTPSRGSFPATGDPPADVITGDTSQRGAHHTVQDPGNV